MITVNIKKKLKGQGGKQLLHINGQFAKGSITKIHGLSGAGKTTFLKILAGLTNADEGLITVDDNIWLDTTKSVNVPPQARKTGFVFQEYALFPNMTVLQHLQYATNNQQWINRLLTIGGLSSLADSTPIYLSGGQQQRLAILRALATKPEIILMDEPFSALDKKTKTSLISHLTPIFKELECTVFIVSHNISELDEFDAGEMEISVHE